MVRKNKRRVNRVENERLYQARQDRLTWWRSLTPSQQQEYVALKEAERYQARMDAEFRGIVGGKASLY